MTIDENTAAPRERLDTIERGPHSLAMLARIFEAMPPDILTSRWVKMFTDSMGELGAHAADIARCLKTVADRLKNRQPSKLRRTPPSKMADEAAPQPMAMAMPTAAPAPVEVATTQHEQPLTVRDLVSKQAQTT